MQLRLCPRIWGEKATIEGRRLILRPEIADAVFLKSTSPIPKRTLVDP